MRVRLRALLLLAVLLPGCAGTLGKLRRAWRTPGEKLAALPDEVGRQYDCEHNRLPFFTLERNEINPNRVEAGAEFNHRMVYALCPRRATEVVTGTFTTQILFRGRILVRDRIPDFELKPGRWVLDSFVRLPEDAETGIYALEIRFRSAKVHLDKSLVFGVEARQP